MRKNLFICLILTSLLGLWSIETNAQVNVPSSTYSSLGYVGWSGVFDVPFQIGGSTFMTLQNTTGNVGIGTTSPSQLLQVLGGFIDVNTVNMGYMINQDTILWHAGNKTNLFVGVGAGNSGQTGSANTYVGGNAGNGYADDEWIGWGNTCVGNSAGYWIDEANCNTLIGDSAGWGADQFFRNTCVGHLAGFNPLNGWNLDNICIGDSAGYYNGSSSTCIFIGNRTGVHSTYGADNVYEPNT